MSRIFKNRLGQIDRVSLKDYTKKQGVAAIDFTLFKMPRGVRKFVLQEHSGDKMDIERGAGTNNSVIIYSDGKIRQFCLRLPPKEDDIDLAKESVLQADMPDGTEISKIPIWECPRVSAIDLNLSEGEFLRMLEAFLEEYQPEESDFDAESRLANLTR